MNLDHLPEHDELRSTLRRWFSVHMDEPSVRADAETSTGYRAEAWQQFCGQLGMAGIALPEEYGGGGFGQVELGIVAEESGASLACLPLMSSVVLGAGLLLASGDHELCDELIPAIADGSATLAVAVHGHGTNWDGRQEVITGAVVDDGWSLTGSASFVVDGLSADRFLVVASHPDGSSLFLVESDINGVERVPMDTLDETRKQARVEFMHAPARLVGKIGSGEDTLDRAMLRARAALASESVGVCRQMLTMAVEYAKVREQFGRPIGSFQAVKHLCSTMLVETELATSAARVAAFALDEDEPDARIQVEVAAVAASDVLDMVSAEMIEVFGGIGFTWEHPAHLYYKRAVSSARLWGSSTQARARIFAEAAR